MYVDILGHFTHGKAHVSIEFVPYLYRKAMMFDTDISSVQLFYASNLEMGINDAFASIEPCLILSTQASPQTENEQCTGRTFDCYSS